MKDIYVVACDGDQIEMFYNELEASDFCEKKNDEMDEQSSLDGYSFTYHQASVSDNWCRGPMYGIVMSLTSDQYEVNPFCEDSLLRHPELCVVTPCVNFCFGSTGIESNWKPSIHIQSPTSLEEAKQVGSLMLKIFKNMDLDLEDSWGLRTIIRRVVDEYSSLGITSKPYN